MTRTCILVFSLFALLSGCGSAETPVPSAAPTEIQRTPTLTPLPEPSDTPTPTIVGNLGWRKVTGVVYAESVGPGRELSGVLVECSQFSYVPHEGSCAPYQVTTGPDGAFEFDVFVHDTDQITLSGGKPGYAPAEHRITGFDCVGACPTVDLVLTMLLTDRQDLERVNISLTSRRF